MFIINPRPYTTYHVQCNMCNTYIGAIRTTVIGQWTSNSSYLHHDTEIIENRGAINDYVVGGGVRREYVDAAERLAAIRARNKARFEKTGSYTGVTTKLTAQYCRHCGEEIPDMVEDGNWCSYCGGDIRR